ncbi:HPr family phosphocarrier protein [Herbiconiux sp.]|jgi:phosphocarrier protein HPr|uniref:HPr family phosphocarrier protein n=1 Tax=Herbiconiux sp. TaxID=1871186 RepID=UPI0025BCB7F5|nr:HPr family phosphocarrier protein [Herbiconiux sp.]
MPERTAIIASRVGLHARPASIFIDAVKKQPLRITIAKPGGTPMDASSILSIMSLGAANGDTVTLAAEGPEAEESLETLAALLETDLDAS